MDEINSYNSLLKVYMKEKPPETEEEIEVTEKKKPKKTLEQIFFCS